MQNVKIFFDEPRLFNMRNAKPLMGITGLYFLFLSKTQIAYPFGMSRLIYIGMSEKKTNSIGKRLSDHYDGQSGNIGISSYARVEQVLFTHLNFEMLRKLWKQSIEDLESYFILDFVRLYGVYPICNNKTGVVTLGSESSDVNLEIDWRYFEGEGGQK